VPSFSESDVSSLKEVWGAAAGGKLF